MGAAQKLSTDPWDQLIAEVCAKIGATTGNVLTEKQRPMVESRMKRRMLELKFTETSDYRAYWKANDQSETAHLVGLLTTHFTSFFREFSHFEWLASELPALAKAARSEGRDTLWFWSAACSKGQEVWSLAMWLHHHLPKIDPTMKWKVHGTDIDPTSVQEGINGVYHRREIETCPRHLWEGLWVRGKGEIADWYKAKSSINSHVSFGTANLLDLRASDKRYDAIFCRNVLIYFDKANQLKAVGALFKCLSPQGALITGMSESLNGLGLDLKSFAPSVYRTGSAVRALSPKAPEVTTSRAPDLTPPKPMKVLCVDDSATVINILRKLLRAPDYEVVAVATNGVEALEKLKSFSPDVITLDVHMPEMDGPTFLKTSGIAKSIPVVMVSSVGRDDSGLVNPLFDLGVCDFVEKPTLANMKEIGEELTQKLRMAWLSKKKNLTLSRTEASAPSVRSRPAGHIVFNVTAGDRYSLLHVLRQQNWVNDDITIVASGISNLEELRSECAALTSKCKRLTVLPKATPVSTERPVIILHFKHGNTEDLKVLKRSREILIVDDGDTLTQALRGMASDVSPATSFSYLVDKYLGGA